MFCHPICVPGLLTEGLLADAFSVRAIFLMNCQSHSLDIGLEQSAASMEIKIHQALRI
jgi:hypothetical protein